MQCTTLESENLFKRPRTDIFVVFLLGITKIFNSSLSYKGDIKYLTGSLLTHPIKEIYVLPQRERGKSSQHQLQGKGFTTSKIPILIFTFTSTIHPTCCPPIRNKINFKLQQQKNKTKQGRILRSTTRNKLRFKQS